MTARAEVAGDLQLCEGCERLLPRELLCSLTAYCLACLAEVIVQDEASRREVALATLGWELRRIPSLTEGDIAVITGIVERARA